MLPVPSAPVVTVNDFDQDHPVVKDDYHGAGFLGGVAIIPLAWPSDSGLALVDGPNLRCAVYDLLRRHPRPGEHVDLKYTRIFLRDVIGTRRFAYVIRENRPGEHQRVRLHVERAGWKFVTVSECKFGQDPGDPVDDYIRHRIQEQIQESGLKNKTICLVSHDGGYAPALKRFQQSGGRVFIVGFTQLMSQRLLQMATERQACLLDLVGDVGAFQLPAAAPQPQIPTQANEMDLRSSQSTH